jgi:hypothetical protein
MPAASIPLLARDREKYVFVGKTVWDVEAGKPLADETGLQIIDGSFQIKGAPNCFYSAAANRGTPDMPLSGFIYGPDSPPQRPSLTPGTATNLLEFPGYWMNADRRRVVWIEQGDFWRGEIDWPGSRIVNRKRVTNTGSFQAWMAPLLWWEQLLFVYGDFDKEKPIVRINLATGAADELNTYQAFTKEPPSNTNIHALCSPTFCRVVNVTPMAIYCYDARSDKTTFIYNKLERVRSEFSNTTPEADQVVWADDDVFYTYSKDALVTKVDVRNGRMVIVYKPSAIPGNQRRPSRIVQNAVPGGRYIDVVTMADNSSGSASFVERSLLDLTNGETKALPFTQADYGQ